VIIKPLHPKLANAFGYRLIQRASVHSHTWPAIVTVTKRALCSSLPVPRSTADENSNHNHFILEQDSFTVQLTFSDGKCSSSIYLLAFHLCFVSKTLSFCLQITFIHFCWSYCLFMTFCHSKLVRQQKCYYKLCFLSPPNRPFLLHRPPRVSHRPRWAAPPTFGTTVINEWLCNVELFPKVWILEILIKVFWISGSATGSCLKAVFGYPYPLANSLSCRIFNRQNK